MPSSTPVPTIEDFRAVARKGIRGFRDPLLSLRSGGGYDLTQGPAAVIWSRQAQRDRGLFLQVYTESSTDADRDRLVKAYYHVERVEATYGTGIAAFVRPTAAAGAGTIYAGTRISVPMPGRPPAVYTVISNTNIGSQLDVPVPIRATQYGSGVATSAVAPSLHLDDSVFDASLVPVSLVCADGTDREDDDAYLARARADLRANRVGHLEAIIAACKAEGAYNIVALHSGTFGEENDFGLNHVYISDANFVTTDELKKACFLALDAWRVAGCDLQVLGMTTATITVTLVVRLVKDPGAFDTATIAEDIRAAVVDEFMGRSDTWTWRTEALRGAASSVSDAIQSVDVTTSPTEPAAAFTATLTRYRLNANDIAVSFTGPT